MLPEMDLFEWLPSVLGAKCVAYGARRASSPSSPSLKKFHMIHVGINHGLLPAERNHLVGDRKSLSALFLPKLSAERLSVFRRSFVVSAETVIFGGNSHFRQKYHLSADILANYFPETRGIFYP